MAEASPIGECAEDYAASYVFDELIDAELATVRYTPAEVTMIHDVDGLARFLDVSVDELGGDHLSFVEDGALVVPWAVTERIARRAAQRNPEPILRHVDKEEAEQRRKMMHGEWYPASRGFPAGFIKPEAIVEDDEESYNRPCRELLRQWCGVVAVERWDELKELRKEVARLGQLVGDAVTVLRRVGADKEAGQIERALGVTVQELRGR